MRSTLAPMVTVLLAVGATCVHGQTTDATGSDGVTLRYQAHTQVYDVRTRAVQLDEVGDELEAEEQTLSIRASFADGELDFSVEGAGDPVQLDYAMDAMGVHIPSEWVPAQWAVPVLPALRLPDEPVRAGSTWSERFRLLLTESELEGAGRIDYRVSAVEGSRVTITFRGRGNGVRRVDGGEVGTGRPVFLNADTSRRGEAVFDAATGRIVRLEQTLELRVSAEPLDSRNTADPADTFLQRVRITSTVEAVDAGAP